MNTSFKTIAGIIIFAGVLSLTACDSGNQNAANTEPAATPVTGASAAPQPEVSPSPAVDTGQAAAAPEAGGGAASASPGAGKQLEELLQLAKQGKVPGVEYAAHSGLIDDVEAAWGEPDTKETAGKGIYATYAARHVVFGFNKGSQIFDVRSSASELQKLTLKQIEEVLGKPDDTAVNGSDNIYIYQAGKQYQLKFIIPESAGSVDHISVFSKQDSINNMAG
jgi:hypothetical protein